MAANPEKFGKLIENAFKRYNASEPIAVARWCLGIGRREDAAKCIALEAPSEVPGLYRFQITPLCPPSGPAQRLYQEHPAKSNSQQSDQTLAAGCRASIAMSL